MLELHVTSDSSGSGTLYVSFKCPDRGRNNKTKQGITDDSSVFANEKNQNDLLIKL